MNTNTHITEIANKITAALKYELLSILLVILFTLVLCFGKQSEKHGTMQYRMELLLVVHCFL